MADKKYPMAFCKYCGNPIYVDGKVVNKKGEWACTNCLIEREKK